ncbi:hypothetical protein CLF_104050 [Clonorchis sinensis]|uniref:Uncharacterized protein n=1 Tax=Clonorchis sinensis TaxID=79923 RepID=G7YAU6_CLOSI|nr:hypothetical protein CLF_104050 [Clonorchis sinensis]
MPGILNRKEKEPAGIEPRATRMVGERSVHYTKSTPRRLFGFRLRKLVITYQRAMSPSGIFSLWKSGMMSISKKSVSELATKCVRTYIAIDLAKHPKTYSDQDASRFDRNIKMANWQLKAPKRVRRCNRKFFKTTLLRARNAALRRKQVTPITLSLGKTTSTGSRRTSESGYVVSKITAKRKGSHWNQPRQEAKVHHKKLIGNKR